MNDLDDLVRDTMRARVERPPVLRSSTDRVIAGARAMRRRRQVATAFAGVTVLVAAIAVTAALRGGPEAHPPGTRTGTEPTPSLQYRADVLTGDDRRTLVTAEGRTLSLAPIRGEVEKVYRAADGWLVVTSDGAPGHALWLLRPDGSAYQIVADADIEPAIAPDGRRIAWRAGDRLHVGHVSGRTLVNDASTLAPARGAPVAYTGTAVVLGYSATGGGVDRHDVWVPTRGAYVASWERSTSVVSVYQPAPDGTLYGLVRPPGGGKSTCLAELDPAANLRATRTACGLPLTIDPLGLVSSGGFWLAAPALDEDRPRVVLIDLSLVFRAPTTVASWDAVAPVTWLGSSALVVVGDDGVPKVARLNGGEPFPLSPETPVEPVRRLG